jgi:hypothetical protein
MISVTPEGEDMKWGFNFYPLNDPRSAGFRFFIPNKYNLRVRYNKAAHRFCIQLIRANTEGSGTVVWGNE